MFSMEAWKPRDKFMGKHWNGLPREAPSLGVLQERVPVAPEAWFSGTGLTLGLVNLRGLFQPYRFYSSMKCL